MTKESTFSGKFYLCHSVGVAYSLKDPAMYFRQGSLVSKCSSVLKA